MIEQLAIAVFGVATVYLSQDARPQLRRWACVVGLAGVMLYAITQDPVVTRS